MAKIVITMPGMSAAQRSAAARRRRKLRGIELPSEAWVAIQEIADHFNEPARSAATRGVIAYAEILREQRESKT